MLKPRQTTADGPPFGGPGPASPPASPIRPSLPLSISPIDSETGAQTVTLTLDTTTMTMTIPADSSTSLTSFQTSSVLTSIPTSTPTSTVSAPTSTPSSPAGDPSFVFNTPFNTTTCVPLQITWNISPSLPITVTGMNVDLGIVSIGNSDVNTTITTDWPVQDDPFTWSSVSVTPGEYQLTARWSDGHGPTVQSSVFGVTPGADTSCVAGLGGSPINTSSKSTNKGAIAGGTVGGVIILACVGVALFFLCGPRPRRDQRARGRGFRRGWGGLGSMDSKTTPLHGVEPGDSNDYLDAGAAGREIPVATGVGSIASLDGEKIAPPPLSATPESKTPWATPTVELARLPSRPTVPDSPRSSLDFPPDPFTAPPSRRASRTPRKPVPMYDPTPDELAAMEMARTRSDQSYARSSVSDVVHQPSSSLSSSGASHHELRSKSSGLLDGQPVHYLIPDPPSQPPS